jgi:exopolysaccharide biosynthesis WecB/TagA/CpsF family protein
MKLPFDGDHTDRDLSQGDGTPWRGPDVASINRTSPTTRLPDRAPIPEPVVVLGIPFAPLTFEAAVARIEDMIASRQSHQIVLANAHTLNLAGRDPAYHAILRDASLVLRDGIGIELAALLARKRLPHNFVGTDFVPDALAALASRRPSVFLYGAAPGVATRAASVLGDRAGGIRIVGTEHGYGDPQAAVERVAAVRPDVLLVARGNPLQEQWIASNLPHLETRVAIGVGALFDYLAGGVRRAPRLVRALRSEWMFRLLVEPRRLWRRYLLGNAEFLWRVVCAGPGGRS